MPVWGDAWDFLLKTKTSTFFALFAFLNEYSLSYAVEKGGKGAENGLFLRSS
jgi:hypothetical protein